MYYFFLSLAETRWSASGMNLNPAEVEKNWRTALEFFKKSRNLESGMVEEISAILRKADANFDGSLSVEELNSIVADRTPK
jgi:hypothetical protein